ncbi:MAG: homoserine kinase [Candidatus Taylorbacteria bacterium]|nr:homoserine kinase [Candidatus Taylorbacteria bacterium]
MYSLEEILTLYDIGTVTGVTPLEGGIINKTWKVKASTGIFVLQKVSAIFAPSVMNDTEAVLNYLRAKGQNVMSIVKTKSNDFLVNDTNGFWRMFTFIEGKVFSEIVTPKVAYEAGKLLGTYHLLLSDFVYDFKHIRGIKHNIPALFKAYKKAVEHNTNPEIEVMLPIINQMIELDLPSHLRKTVNHGDPKISNYIFESKDNPQAVAMIDFDDCGKNYNVLHELGGAFRSWAWRTDKGENCFDIEQFTAALKGYYAGSKGFLTDEEWGLIPQVIKLNLLELSSRFVRDYFEDSYFEWDPLLYSSRKEHNLKRAKDHLALYKDICMKEKGIIDSIKLLLGSNN